MALLRKIEHCTTGVLQAWEESFMNWDSTTKHFNQYPKGKVSGTEEPPQGEFHHRGKRRPSHHSSDHDLEVSFIVFHLVTKALCYKYL